MITLYLMNKKGYGVLKSIIENLGSEFIDLVVTAKDTNVLNDYYDDIIKICKEHNINYTDRKNELKTTSKYFFAIGWRWLVHVAMERLIIFHDSLLPRYRGFAPLVTYLINGEKEIGVTALFAQKEYDCGDIINQDLIQIEYPIKISEAIDKIIPLYQKLAIDICKNIKDNKEITSTPQDEKKATYSLWKDENDYWIDWSRSAKYIVRFINAVDYPFKGAATKVDGKQVRIFDAEEIEDVKIEIRDVGKVIFLKESFPVVVCGDGLILIKKMVYEDTKKSALPLKRFRVRFGY